MNDPHDSPRAFVFVDAGVTAIRALSPNLVRVTFAASEFSFLANNGFDQRIKIVLPAASHDGSGFENFPRGIDWYAQWRLQDPSIRNDFRTYTIRHARPESRELDVDFVVHGESGPASRWVMNATPGDTLVLWIPDSRFVAERHGGVEYVPPEAGLGSVLIGDETALPAIASIAQTLDQKEPLQIVLSVPVLADHAALDIVRTSAIVTVIEQGHHGARQKVLTAAATALDNLRSANARADAHGVEPTVWIAGESHLIKAVRRHLVEHSHLARGQITFRGYWKRGHAEDQ